MANSHISAQNPLLPPPPGFRYGVFLADLANRQVYYIVLFVGSTPTSENSFGYITVGIPYGFAKRAEISMAAAVKGYGPLLYDTAAHVIGQTLYPSSELTVHSKRFWANQPTDYVRPLYYDEAVKKYGVYPWRDPALNLTVEEKIKASGLAWQAYRMGYWPKNKAAANPLTSPDDSLRVYFGRLGNLREVALFRSPYTSPDDLVAYVSASQIASENNIWRVGTGAAVSGYGPVIYDLMAISLQAPLYPSFLQSQAARKFWAKQKKQKIMPLTPDEWEAKYGVPEPLVGKLTPFNVAEIRHTASMAAEHKSMDRGKRSAQELRKHLGLR